MNQREVMELVRSMLDDRDLDDGSNLTAVTGNFGQSLRLFLDGEFLGSFTLDGPLD